MVNVAVLVPRRADDGRRDEIWGWVSARWEREHPDWPLTEGHHEEDGPFNRAVAVNQAAREAGAWDVAVIADSDSFVGREQLDQAVDACARTGQMTLAFDRFAYLSRKMSDLVLAGYTGDWTTGVEFSLQGTCSSTVVVTRAVWDEAEGFDEGFVGWGGEDIAFSHKAQTFGGGLQRIPGFVWHLWHAPSPHPNVDSWLPRCEQYARASYDRQAMHELMDQLRVHV